MYLEMLPCLTLSIITGRSGSSFVFRNLWCHVTGSTGWLQSVYAGAAAVVEALGGHAVPPANQGRLPWDTEQLIYTVREPFPSKVTQTGMAFGTIRESKPLVLTSHMAENGVVFSDGMEMDYLPFNAGSTATIGIAPRQARLVVA